MSTVNDDRPPDPQDAEGEPERGAAPGPTIVARRGALALEDELFRRLDPLLAAARRRPELLVRPVRLVVPSRSLRQHLTAILVRRRRRQHAAAGGGGVAGGVAGKAVAGVTVATLYGIALTIFDAAGEAPPGGGGLQLELLARRFARGQPSLSDPLAPLEDALGTVTGSVRDLLDAGFSPSHLEALAELIDAADVSPAIRRRGRAVARVAAMCAAGLDQLEAGWRGEVYARAAELLRQRPELLPARAVLIHGYADATGVALDLLQALLELPRLASGAAERPSAWLFLDLPPDPALPPDREPHVPAPPGDRPATAGREFPARLVERLAGRTVGELDGALRELLSQGPETAVERWLEAAPAVAGVAGEERSWLLLDLKVGLRSLGCGRLRQVAELDAAAALDGSSSLPLPVRLGGASPKRDEGAPGEDPAARGGAEAVGDDGTARRRPGGIGMRRRRLSGALLTRAVERAAALVDRLARRPGEASLADHVGWLRGLLEDELGWPAPPAPSEAAPGEAAAAEAVSLEVGTAIWAALDRLTEGRLAELTVSDGELALLLDRAMSGIGERPLGGRGGGVQLLSATEARARTWDHLFLLGLNRDLFPRQVREDPLLPDSLRGALTPLLPDLPIKSLGHAEERYLFAHLAASAPRITLSWCQLDDDGQEVAPSPLIERLLLERPELAARVAEVPHAHDPPLHDPAAHGPPAHGTPGQDRPAAAEGATPRPAPGPEPLADRLLTAALHQGRGAFGTLLPAALEATLEEVAGDLAADRPRADRAAALARFRLAALAELDPDLATVDGRAAGRRLGPYLGLVGEGWQEAAGDLYVTSLERVATCPWQAFLTKGLRLQAPPDPLAGFPRLDGLLVGSVVHAAVERLVGRRWREEGRPPPVALAVSGGGGAPGDEPAPAVTVPWPDGAELRRLAAEVAREVARENGVPGLARPLAARALPFLERAGSAGLAPALSAVGAELTGEASLPGGGRVRFRADLVERLPDGRLRLTDLKSGKTLSDAKKEVTRDRRFLKEIREGRRLQVPAYALAAGSGAPGGRSAQARYLFLGGPDDDELPRIFEIESDDPRVRAAFEAAVGDLLAAWGAGSAVPRLLDHKLENQADPCRWCEVLEACRQRDSGSTRRYTRWLEAARRRAARGESGTERSGIGEGDSGRLPELARRVLDLGRGETGGGGGRR